MRSEDGFVTPQVIGAMGMTMLLLALIANVMIIRYAEAVVQTAAEAGVRQAVAAGSAAACDARIEQMLSTSLVGLSEGVSSPSCQLGPAGAAVVIDATFPGWAPGVPARSVTIRASSGATGAGPS